MPHTILVADRSRTVKRAVKLLLTKNQDWKLLFADTADEVVETARQERPAVVLLDHKLARGESDSALRRLRLDEQTQAIPIVLMSDEQAKDKTDSERSLRKPFDSKMFFDALKTALMSKTEAAIPKKDVKAPQAKDGLLGRDEMEKLTRQIIEEVVWEVVPQLAETIIREELQKILDTSE